MLSGNPLNSFQMLLKIVVFISFISMNMSVALLNIFYRYYLKWLSYFICAYLMMNMQ